MKVTTKINLKSTPSGEGKKLYCVWYDGLGEMYLANDEDHLVKQVCEDCDWEEGEFGYEEIGDIVIE
jgi:uncharacterized protein YodC (DUF2158 family)